MDVFTEVVAKDFLQLSLVLLIISILQLPGVFAAWCMANRIIRESI